MKKLQKTAAFFLTACLLITGCGSDSSANRSNTTSASATVEEVVSAQIANEDAEASADASSDSSNEDTAATTATSDTKVTGDVDYDLTEMSSDMVYAIVYQMVYNPDDYIGKTFRMSGTYYASYYEATDQYYYYCLISDATACCAQGLEFVWGDGSHSYPDEYPADNTEILVQGTFETYVDTDGYTYCHLANAAMEAV
ncbi:MAG: hypothetical protein LUH00_00750 [Lachnospiraceae bacterium]|nr:hypothetical protein [Lachnospiraceae bacterium]